MPPTTANSVVDRCVQPGGDGSQHAARDRGTAHEEDECDDRAEHRKVVGAEEAHAEDHDVSGHVAGEDAVESEIADGVDHAGRERERQHEDQVESFVVCGIRGRHGSPRCADARRAEPDREILSARLVRSVPRCPRRPGQSVTGTLEMRALAVFPARAIATV